MARAHYRYVNRNCCVRLCAPAATWNAHTHICTVCMPQHLQTVCGHWTPPQVKQKWPLIHSINYGAQELPLSKEKIKKKKLPLTKMFFSLTACAYKIDTQITTKKPKIFSLTGGGVYRCRSGQAAPLYVILKWTPLASNSWVRCQSVAPRVVGGDGSVKKFNLFIVKREARTRAHRRFVFGMWIFRLQVLLCVVVVSANVASKHIAVKLLELCARHNFMPPASSHRSCN